MLWTHRGEVLVRSQVLHRMAKPPRERPTPHRIGQILKSLYEHGYLDREIDRFQGRTKSSFYRLNDQGIEACRKHYPFERQERALFRTTEDERKKYLTAKYFLGDPDAPVRRIIGFYAYSGGLGQTSMVAHTANGLALHEQRKKILVVDFDISSPDLDQFFPLEPDKPSTVDANRGLRGLMADYYSQPNFKKNAWLEEVIATDRFVSQPRRKEAPNLFFLRGGMGTTPEGVPTNERSLALNLLQSEVGQTNAIPSSVQQSGFLPSLRSALLKRYDLVLLDSHAGRNASVLALTHLADQWVVSVRPSESPQTLQTLKSVLTCHLRHFDENQRPNAGVLLALHLSGYTTGSFDGLGWIKESLLEDSREQPAMRHHLWLHRHNRRLREPADWKLTRIYEPLVKRLAGIYTTEVYLPPELAAITKILDSATPIDTRALIAGSLEMGSYASFAQFLEGLREERDLLPRLDTHGIQLIHQISATLCTKLTTALQSKD